MAEARRGCHPGWEAITAAAIRVDDLSGLGGGKAYRLPAVDVATHYSGRAMDRERS
jgi:hypothetical protein